MTDPIIVDPNTGELDWTEATTNTDGSPITDGEVTGFTVGVRDTTAAGSVAGSYPFKATAPNTAAATEKELISVLAPILPKGVALVFAVKADTATAANPNLPSSDWSVESVAFELPKPAPVPMPPTNPTVA